MDGRPDVERCWWPKGDAGNDDHRQGGTEGKGVVCGMTARDLEDAGTRVETILGQLDVVGKGIRWRTVEEELHSIYADLWDIETRSPEATKQWIVDAQECLLRAIDACLNREQSIREEVVGAACRLAQVRHV